MITLPDDHSMPLYQALYLQLRQEIQSGALPQGAKLPSTRKLSEQLDVSVNTVDSAYCQLEAEGFVYSVAGRGSFVAEDGDQGRRRMAELTEGLHDTILELRQLGMTEQQWLDLWREEEEK